MSEPFLGEIQIFAFNFAPRGWAKCDGELLPINQYQSLYSLFGTMYGGDGRTDFGLPDLRGRVPIHRNTASGSPAQGTKAGEESVVLMIEQIPAHTHQLMATSSPGSVNIPTGNVLATVSSAFNNAYAPVPATQTNLTNMATGSITTTGNSQGRPNMQPYLAVNFCVALTGVFPSRN